MGITVYLSRNPVFEARKPGSYEEKFVVNRIKEINRQIGTGYTKAFNRLIESNTMKSISKEQRTKYDAITNKRRFNVSREQAH